MKKSFTANISGTIFYIDEDAYNILQSYLDQLHTAFAGDGENEIVDDIEARIGELLAERTTDGNMIVTIKDVNDVIARVGSPAELNEHTRPSQPEDHDSQTSTGAYPPPYYSDDRSGKRLFRDESNRVLGGVLSGLGEYYGWNVGLLRVLAVLLALSTAVMPCFIAYVIAWCVIPAATTPVQQLEMAGVPVNPATLGKKILSNKSAESVANQIGRVLGVGFLALIGMICGSIFIGMVFLFIYSIASIIGITIFSIPMNIFDSDLFIYSHSIPLFTLLLSLAVMIPFGVILWGIGIVLFKLPRIAGSTLIVCGVIEIIVLVALTIAASAMSADLALM